MTPLRDDTTITDGPLQPPSPEQPKSKVHEEAVALRNALSGFLARLNAQQTHSLASGLEAEEKKLIELARQHVQTTAPEEPAAE